MTEGKLLYSSATGRWAIIDSRGKQELTSGRSIDVWLGGQWISGHVERNRFFIAHRGGVCAIDRWLRNRARRFLLGWIAVSKMLPSANILETQS